MIRFELRAGVDAEEARAAFESLGLPFTIGRDMDGDRLALHSKRDAARQSLERFAGLIEHLFDDVADPCQPIAKRARRVGDGTVAEIRHRELQPIVLLDVARKIREALDTGCSLDQAFGLTGRGGGRRADADAAEEQFMIALARHRLGDAPGASDEEVAHQYGCSAAEVSRARERFRTFIEAFVAPST